MYAESSEALQIGDRKILTHDAVLNICIKLTVCEDEFESVVFRSGFPLCRMCADSLLWG